MTVTKWTPEEDQFLIENYPLLGGKETIQLLNEHYHNNRTERAGYKRVEILRKQGLMDLPKKERMYWTAAEDQILKENYPISGSKGVSELLFERLKSIRTEDAVQHRADYLGIKYIKLQIDEAWVQNNYMHFERNKDLWEKYNETHDRQVAYSSFEGYLIRTGYQRMFTDEMLEFLAEHYADWGAKRAQKELLERFGVLKSIHSIHFQMSQLKIGISKEVMSKLIGDSQDSYPEGSIRIHGTKRKYAVIKTKDGWKPYAKHILKNNNDDYIATPLDHNQSNMNPENWVLIPKKHVVIMSKNKLWSTDPEVTKTAIMLCELIDVMKQQEKENQNEST